AGLVGTGVYFAVHTAGDWIWTIPAAALPAFLLVGIGASPNDDGPLPRTVAIPAGIAALALAVAVFTPPWLSAKLVDRAYEAPDAAAAAGDLRWARRLDPLSVDPLLAEAALAPPPANPRPLPPAVGKRQPCNRRD